jgi:polyisoprenoid-binding protein YceI
MLLDKADLTKSSIAVTLPVEGLDTGVAKLDEALKSPDFLDATRYPTIAFKSTKVEKTGENVLLTRSGHAANAATGDAGAYSG